MRESEVKNLVARVMAAKGECELDADEKFALADILDASLKLNKKYRSEFGHTADGVPFFPNTRYYEPTGAFWESSFCFIRGYDGLETERPADYSLCASPTAAHRLASAVATPAGK